ncbi:MAG: hypothetical protein OSB38_33260 [Paraburkholderia fungorum]|nr:hypothetical protein [Paraburkholderia fungorum]
MTNRELLELAARAAGISGQYVQEHFAYGDEWIEGIDTGATIYWSPLADDGDALRLAVKLKLLVGVHLDETWAQSYGTEDGKWLTCKEPHANSPDAATRRAIVRAAAEIGRSLSPCVTDWDVAQATEQHEPERGIDYRFLGVTGMEDE